MQDRGENITIDLADLLATPGSGERTAARMRLLMQQYDMRAQQLLERGVSEGGYEEREWQAVGAKLAAMGVHSSWLDLGNTAMRIKAAQAAQEAHGSTESGRRMGLVYENYNLTQPFPLDGQLRVGEQVEIESIDDRVARHYRAGNRRLVEQGFRAETVDDRELVPDRGAMDGLMTMIREACEALDGADAIPENLIILVGERRYAEGVLKTFVRGAFIPDHQTVGRGIGEMKIDWAKVMDEIEGIDLRDQEMNRLPKEMVGLIHIHPPEKVNGKWMVAGKLSPEDEQVLQGFDHYAPGFILGAVSPGVSRFDGTILRDLAYWNRRMGRAEQISTVRQPRRWK